MNLNQRSAGVLLHITSLPGPHGIGDFGPDAFRFVDWLADGRAAHLAMVADHADRSGQFALPERVGLRRQSADGGAGAAGRQRAGWRSRSCRRAASTADRVDFGQVRALARAAVAQPRRMASSRSASATTAPRSPPGPRRRPAGSTTTRCSWRSGRRARWPALVGLAGAAAPAATPAALAAARSEHADEIRFWQFVQWCFDTPVRRAQGLRQRARRVDHGRPADLRRPPQRRLLVAPGPVLARREFPAHRGRRRAARRHRPAGQRWGNPLYRWDRMAAEDFAWWTARVRRALDSGRRRAHRPLPRLRRLLGDSRQLPDRRSKAAGCPARARRCSTPSRGALGELPIVAEDLGLITPDVVELRDGCGFPGMKILQFAFGGDGGARIPAAQLRARNAWPTPAPTTTTPRAAGGTTRPRTSATSPAVYLDCGRGGRALGA